MPLVLDPAPFLRELNYRWISTTGGLLAHHLEPPEPRRRHASNYTSLEGTSFEIKPRSVCLKFSGSLVPAAQGGARAGHQSSISSDCNVTPVSLARVTQNATSNSAQQSPLGRNSVTKKASPACNNVKTTKTGQKSVAVYHEGTKTSSVPEGMEPDPKPEALEHDVDGTKTGPKSVTVEHKAPTMVSDFARLGD
ncbi:hypothetical protein FF38_00515 [Lucilia cuprina]|uniref:Uncharacterized protein n=1 Tax=Lucilia cuprina TaxID=7375 RepID=A0A0L0BTL9_LUCCU|nr:hypothetical protein FF38_00515 [Lucilia cuprina]